MRKCVRHGITRNGLVLYAGEKKKKKEKQAEAGSIHGLERSISAQGARCQLCTPTRSVKLTSNRLHSKRTPQRPLQRWQLQAGLVVGCRGTSLLPCTIRLSGPGSQERPSASLMPFGSRAGLDVTSPQGMLPVSWVSAKHVHPPVSHLNFRALGRGPCCLPIPIVGPESCDQLCRCTKNRRWGRGEAPALPVQHDERAAALLHRYFLQSIHQNHPPL